MNFARAYHPHWNTSEKLLVRFLLLYFTTYILLQFLSQPAEPLVRLAGHLILGVEKELQFFATGSGDSTYAYVLLFVNFLITLLGTIIWTLADRKRASYNALFYWLLVILRIFLAMMLLSYGFAKVYKTQFPEPSLIRLLQPLGSFSPMGLAWTYMGFSEAYNLYTGLLEVIGGLLLIWRRTTTLGALLVAGVMSHVVVMNFTYDIPVKLFSMHLLAIAIILIATDRKRLYNLFFRNKATSSIIEYDPIKNKRYQKIKTGLKLASVILFIGVSVWQGYTNERSFGDKRAKPPLYGIWEVQQMKVNDSLVAPLITNDARWRYFVIDYKNRCSILYMNNEVKWLNLEIDTSQSKLSIYNYDYEQHDNFSFTRDDDRLNIKGKLGRDSLDIQMKAKDLNEMLLPNRGFHWINEYPFNR